jgi:diguanylate cyclase (GGDEF)-like protein
LSHDPRRIRIENELLARLERKGSEETEANLFMSLLMDQYPLLSAVAIVVEPGTGGPTLFAHRGLSHQNIKEIYAGKDLPVLTEALREEVHIGPDDLRAKDPAYRIEHGYRSLLAIPCRMQGETLGVFIADSNDPELFTEEIREDFRAYGRIIALLLALRNLKGRISKVPDVDSVTGLVMFKGFHEVLHRELTRAGKFRLPLSLLFVRIQNLREMNNVYGHVEADSALAEAAARVRGHLRVVDSPARSGGMIYVVMPGMGKEDAARTAERIAGAMESSPVGKGKVFLRFAIGVTTYPEDGDTERILIPHTDAMVLESVRKGGNAVSVFRSKI